MYKVYIVDDAVLVRKEIVLTTPWEALNCMVVGEAGDAHTAFEEIQKLQPDIVITDIKMNQKTGLDLIRELKADNCNAEYIVISGYSEFEYAFNSIKLEVQNYILKPISDGELMDTLKKTIKQIEAKKRTDIITQKIQVTEFLGDVRADLLEDYANSKLSIYLRKAMEYINLHYMEEITVKEVANELYISESYLTKLFKQEITITFIDYLTQVRIRNSIELLRNINLPIYEISDRVGYKDYRYYSQVFKKLIGISPKEYQKKLTN